MTTTTAEITVNDLKDRLLEYIAQNEPNENKLIIMAELAKTLYEAGCEKRAKRVLERMKDFANEHVQQKIDKKLCWINFNPN